jgi:hypothetical protein
MGEINVGITLKEHVEIGSSWDLPCRTRDPWVAVITYNIKKE